MRLLSPPLQEVASCGFASIAGSTFNANAAGGAGGALSSDGATLPVALSCDAATAANAPSYATAAEQQRNFTAPSFPSGGHHVTVPMFITSVIAVGMLDFGMPSVHGHCHACQLIRSWRHLQQEAASTGLISVRQTDVAVKPLSWHVQRARGHSQATRLLLTAATSLQGQAA